MKRLRVSISKSSERNGTLILPTIRLSSRKRALRNGPSIGVAVDLLFWNVGVRIAAQWNPEYWPQPEQQNFTALNELRWNEAPNWATHIVGCPDNLDLCFWAEDVNGLMCDEHSRIQAVHGYDVGDELEEGAWKVYETRPLAMSN